MNDVSALTVTCDKCQTRFRIKAGMAKVMKSIRCSKCGQTIPLVQPPVAAVPNPTIAAETPPPPPPVMEKNEKVEPAVLSTPVTAPVVPPPTPPPTPPAAPVAPPVAAPVAAPVAPPVSVVAPAEASAPPVTHDESAAMREEIANLRMALAAMRADAETLKAKLRTTEAELAEADARVASLQELWHSKELETREMITRASRAEKEAQEAITIRDEFLARAKSELAAYLVGERDAALSRFSDLEKRLLSIKPRA